MFAYDFFGKKTLFDLIYFSWINRRRMNKREKGDKERGSWLEKERYVKKEKDRKRVRKIGKEVKKVKDR